MQNDAMSDEEDLPEASAASTATDERTNLAAYMLGRQQICEDDDDDEDEVLAAAAAARKNRRQAERATGREVAGLVQRAQELTSQSRHMDAVGVYTEALALEPMNVNLLAARASLTGRLNLHQAVLHDGEEIVKITPDWHQGHAICGMALFCLHQWAPSVRAYRKALEYASDAQGRQGLLQALDQAQTRADDELRQAALKEDLPQLTRLLFGGAGADGAAHSIVSLEAKEPAHGFSALALAVAAGKVESVKLLLKAGADANARDNFGKTPLM